MIKMANGIFQAKVSAIHSRLCKTNFTEDHLCNPEEVTSIPFPCASSSALPDRFSVDADGRFEFMGRENIKPLLILMRTLLSGGTIYCRISGITNYGATVILNVYGTRGYGKSFMLAAAVGLLLKEGHPVVFIPNALDLVSNALECLQAGLAVAFPDMVKEIELCRSESELIDLVYGMHFLLVVDQLNALEETAGLDRTEVQQASKLLKSIRSSRPYVRGYSANNYNATIF
eukprot:Opistho-2@877